MGLGGGERFALNACPSSLDPQPSTLDLSDIEISDIEGVFFDELAAGFDVVSH